MPAKYPVLKPNEKMEINQIGNGENYYEKF